MSGGGELPPAAAARKEGGPIHDDALGVPTQKILVKWRFGATIRIEMWPEAHGYIVHHLPIMLESRLDQGR
jgi:hypothetical protein